MKILVVSEGKNELGTWTDDGRVVLESPLVRLIDRVLADRVPEPIDYELEIGSSLKKSNVQMKGRTSASYQKKALLWIREAMNREKDALVMVVDQDRDQDRREGLNSAQADTRFPIQRAFGLAIYEFEAWLLSDEVALSQTLGRKIQRQKNPESLKDPKPILHALIGETPKDRTSIYREICAVLSFDTLIERCPLGFQPFHQRLMELGSPQN